MADPRVSRPIGWYQEHPKSADMKVPLDEEFPELTFLLVDFLHIK